MEEVSFIIGGLYYLPTNASASRGGHSVLGRVSAVVGSCHSQDSKILLNSLAAVIPHFPRNTYRSYTGAVGSCVIQMTTNSLPTHKSSPRLVILSD